MVTQPLVTEPVKDVPRPRLSAVPGPGQPADRRVEVARWVVTLSEPLLRTADRSQTDQAMAAFINRNRDWACAYFAGLLTDLSGSLPRDDPWTCLSATIDLDQVASDHPSGDPDRKLVWAGAAPLPEDTGATIVGLPGHQPRVFGTRTDALDLVPLDVVDPSASREMASLTVNLAPLSAALVGFASADARTMQFVLSEVCHHLMLAFLSSATTDTVGESLLKTAGQAVQWLVHRRRQYLGGDDDGFAHTVGFEWMSKADRVNTGKPIATESSLRGLSHIPADAYRDLAGDAYLEDDDDE